ncbi:MAG: FmdB family zinc ribbon protein [Fibrobacterota bacterium]
MPTYTYECLKCGHIFNAFHSMTAEPVTSCPREECGGNVKRHIGAGAGPIFKGTGFYQTDFKNKPSGAQKDKGAASE